MLALFWENIMNKDKELIDRLRNKDGIILRRNIRKIIPYDDAFLFVDKILKLNEKEIEAEYYVDPSIDFFRAHFVGFPIMPAALNTEGFGQAGTILIRYNLENHQEKHILIYKIEDGRFLSAIFPGQTILYNVKLSTMDHRAARIEGNTMVGKRKASSYRMVMGIIEKAKLIRC